MDICVNHQWAHEHVTNYIYMHVNNQTDEKHSKSIILLYYINHILNSTKSSVLLLTLKKSLFIIMQVKLFNSLIHLFQTCHSFTGLQCFIYLLSH